MKAEDVICYKLIELDERATRVAGSYTLRNHIILFSEQLAQALRDADLLKEPKPKPERDNNRCAVCAWPLSDSWEKGCVRGNCSLRPAVAKFLYYDPERAKAEIEELSKEQP